MTKLTERALVKDLIGLARADMLYDAVLDGMIETASNEVELHCRRNFTYGVRTEYHQSYEQSYGDMNPQYVWLDSPIDIAQPLVINWSWQDGAELGQELEPESYTINAEQGLLSIQQMLSNHGYTNLPWPWSRTFVNSTTGLKITYVAGYAVTVPPTSGYVYDPMDDYGVVQVPAGLKVAVAQKVATDFKNDKQMTAWSDDQLRMLRPYKKKDIIG